MNNDLKGIAAGSPRDDSKDREPGSSPIGSHRFRWARHLSLMNMGVVYLEIALIILFALWAPQTFPTMTTVRSVLNGMAVSGLLTLALVIPLSSGVFDLSVGSAMGLTNMLIAWLLVTHNWPIAPAVLVTLGAGVVIGVFNGLIVVGARIDSFIGTLATASLFDTFGSALSNEAITGNQLNGSFSKIASVGAFGLESPFYLLIALALVCWIFQKYTVTGRRLYAVGFSDRASALLGIQVRRLRFAGLMLSGSVAAVAGILLASTVATGTPGIGSSYLLNAYAAAFLGATQFGGRFNAWGTVWAVLLLNTGTNGIYLVGGAPWAQSLFSGVVLLLALGASNLEQAIRARSWIRTRTSRWTGPSLSETEEGHH